MPSVIGYANLLQQGKLNQAFISSPQYNKIRRLLDDLVDEEIELAKDKNAIPKVDTAADKLMDEIQKLLKVSDLKGTMEMVTTAITACKGDRKWKADLSKELHSRLTSAIDILMVNAKSY